ncbi:MAG: ATP:cob(I)alamin adenosyltransferase [bacterium TMED198]|nr:MAG: ATP:cob(I)alamin adenosyltransferase [bacterium TMED198]|tara:strand:- start:100 stop:735 length:636 start_codon:yes stop_codon:yes gene_type:complete
MRDKKKYRDPKITINRVYTKSGDSGTTSLVGGQKVPKNHPRIYAYGDLDELNVVIGGCREWIKEYTQDNQDFMWLYNTLERVQNELFNLGTMLATPTKDMGPQIPVIADEDVVQLENDIDRVNKDLSTLASFVLPGGSQANIWFHLGRTVCRRVERQCISLSADGEISLIVVKYLNRLSDALFVWSRWVNLQFNCNEHIWQPNNTSSGSKK